MMKWLMPVVAKARADAAGSAAKMPGLPTSRSAAKNMGAPIGIEIAVACTAEPVTTPRRTAAFPHANVPAHSNANTAPSTAASPRFTTNYPNRRGRETAPARPVTDRYDVRPDYGRRSTPPLEARTMVAEFSLALRDTLAPRQR